MGRELKVNGARHNVVFVATQHDSLYAFDADADPCFQLWSVSLIDSTHGGTPGETVSVGPRELLGKGYGDVTPEVGVTSTAVIDPAASSTSSPNQWMGPETPSTRPACHRRDHGKEKSASPVLIQGTYRAPAMAVPVTPLTQGRRPTTGAGLANDAVYVAWSSHEDQRSDYGWVMGYRYGTSGFSQTAVLNVTPTCRMAASGWVAALPPSIPMAICT